MRALRLSSPGSFEWIALPETAAPGPGEALVAVHAIGICGTDIAGYQGKMPFIQYPRILGHELGVEVLATGAGVTHLQPGDRCSVEPYLNCGRCRPCLLGRTNCCEYLQVLGVHCDGGMRERILLPAAKLHPSPDTVLDYEQLALVETLAIGCHAVKRARLTPEEDVLIIGAGPIGLTVLEFARLGGRKVTVLELNETRRQFVTRHYPGTQVVDSLPDGPVAHTVFDATGHAGSMAAALGYARFAGQVVYVGITKEPVPLDDPLFHRRELTLLASRNAQAEDFPFILDLLRSGTINTAPWISHRCAFEELPETLPAWMAPGSGLIKAVVRLGTGD
ncbi:MAG TPA: zinc-binding alcohol dehydrogenase family protein [Prosthecobacter sp.]